MDLQDLKKFPDSPGVYIMKGRAGGVLYIGKANNLKQRLRQYFVPGGDGRPMIPFLIPKVHSIDTLVVNSEKEALLLECNLIKQHKPRYNALLKDDKSYIALKITKHPWPRIDLVRYRGKPKKDGLYFGPYTSAHSARRTLDMLQRIFPLRQCSDEEFARRTRPCILYDMKRCIAPCVGKCTQDEYDRLVQKVTKFLKGQDKEIVKELYQEMEALSEKMEFEKAGDVLEKIRHLEKTVEKQHVDRPLGEDVDAIGLFRQGEESVISVLFFRSGRLGGSRHYHFSQTAEEDSELIATALMQLYQESQTGAKELLLPVFMSDLNALSEIIGIHLSVPQKGVKRTYVEMAEMNAEAEFLKEKDTKAILEGTLSQMQEKFRLKRFPAWIECYDTSHLFGEQASASLVVFKEGQKDSSSYRKYKIQSTSVPDDLALMREVLQRRFKKGSEGEDLPDLVIVDGGKGQLNMALKVLKSLNIINVDVIGLAKEKSLHTKGATLEQVFLPEIKDPILLPRNSSILFLLQKIRDEAHRFALTFHRKRKSKEMVSSVLDEITGIGPIKKKRLIRKFGSPKKVLEATKEELLSVPGITEKDVNHLLNRS